MRIAIQRVKWRIQRLFGLADKAWDEQFQEGIWGQDQTSPHVLERVLRLCQGGRIIEFGCATGQLPMDLPRASFSYYLGLDFSGYAIEVATKRAEELNIDNCQFAQGDMASWSGDSDVSLIIFLESLYYLKGNELTRFLERCRDSLSPDGRILVVVHSAEKHKKTLSACRAICRVVDEEPIGSRTYLTLARPE